MSARILAAMFVSILAFAAAASEARAADTFGDGLFEADCVAPTAGWFVPFAVLRKSFEVPPESVIAASRPMAASELAGYASGGDGLLVSEDHLLFAFPNQGSNAFLWTGSRDIAQPMHLRTWNGEFWDLGGTAERADSAEFVFRASPPDAAVVHVLLEQQRGATIRTERVRLARFPGTMPILERGLERADTVVSLPFFMAKGPWPQRLDCLKGEIDVETLRSLPGGENVRGRSIAFVSGSGRDRRVDVVFDADSGTFIGAYGRIRDPEYRPSDRPHDFIRWRLARLGVPSSQTATLEITERGGPDRKGWIGIELAVGLDAPGDLFESPITRSGRDGGNPLFSFEISHAGSVKEITTRGRFGMESFDAAEPETESALGIDYRFVRCGSAVVKLEIRPRTLPWRGEVRARVLSWARLGRRSEESVVTSSIPIAAD